MNTLGVGVIGGSATGWAAESHVPALTALPGYENTFITPGFAHAVTRHRLIATIEEAARSGVRQILTSTRGPG